MDSSMLATLHLPHLPPDLAVHVALFRDLGNAVYLRGQLLAGNADYEYAFIDASTILSKTHLLAAIFRAATDMINKRMKSHNVHSEIVFALSPNNNIAESFRKFGISENTKDLLAVKLTTSPTIDAESVAFHLGAIDGTTIEFSDANLNEISDITQIMKTYKIQQMPPDIVPREKDRSQDGSGQSSHQIDRKKIEDAILGLIALRGAS